MSAGWKTHYLCFQSGNSCAALAQALITLVDLYNTVSARGEPAPCEAEFRAYALLTMIGTHGKFQYSTATFLNMLRVRPMPSS